MSDPISFGTEVHEEEKLIPAFNFEHGVRYPGESCVELLGRTLGGTDEWLRGNVVIVNDAARYLDS